VILSKNQVAILGAGGHTRSVISLLNQNDIPIIGIFDDSYDPLSLESILGVRLMGKISDIPEGAHVILSIGDNLQREKLYCEHEESIYPTPVIAATAHIDVSVRLDRGSMVFGNVYVNACAQVGVNTIINTAAVVEHEARIGNNCHISVNSTVCGRVVIGDECFIGAGAVIIDKVTICDKVTIGAGSVVIKDIITPGVYAGNPVRKIR